VRAFNPPNDKADTIKAHVHRVAPLCRVFSFKAADGRIFATHQFPFQSADVLEGYVIQPIATLHMPVSQNEATTPTRWQSSQHDFDSVLRRLLLESQTPGNIPLASGRLSRSTWKSFGRQDREARVFPRGSQARVTLDNLGSVGSSIGDVFSPLVAFEADRNLP
jgi:hypothetical protein